MYNPGTVRVTVNVLPWKIRSELKVEAPEGTRNEVTVCAIPSSFTHSIVLLTPIVTVMLTG